MVMGLVFGVLASFFWFGFDVTRKRAGEEMSATGSLAGFMILQIPILGGLLLAGHLIGGSPETGGVEHMMLSGFPEQYPAGYWWRLGVSFVLNVAANVLFLRAVQVSPLSLTTPYLGLTPVFTALGAWPVMGQRPSTLGWVGIGIVCVCAFFLNTPKDQGILGPIKALAKERGSLYMVGVALLWSITPLLDKSATEQTSVLWHVFMLNGGLGVAYLGWRLWKDRGGKELWVKARKTKWPLILGTLALAGGMLFQFSSYPFMDVAVVETMKRCVGVSGAMVVGYFFWKEDVTWWRVGCAMVMVGGVALVLQG